MNISSSEMDLASLAARIEQLEAEQNLRRKNIVWLKNYFDALKQEFQDRPELQQIQCMEEAISQLTAQVAELQQHFNHSPTPSLINSLDNLNNNDVTGTTTEKANIDDDEIVKKFFERVEQQKETSVLTDTATIIENASLAETEQDNLINIAEEQVQNGTAFNEQSYPPGMKQVVYYNYF